MLEAFLRDCGDHLQRGSFRQSPSKKRVIAESRRVITTSAACMRRGRVAGVWCFGMRHISMPEAVSLLAVANSSTPSFPHATPINDTSRLSPGTRDKISRLFLEGCACCIQALDQARTPLMPIHAQCVSQARLHGDVHLGQARASNG